MTVNVELSVWCEFCDDELKAEICGDGARLEVEPCEKCMERNYNLGREDLKKICHSCGRPIQVMEVMSSEVKLQCDHCRQLDKPLS